MDVTNDGGRRAPVVGLGISGVAAALRLRQIGWTPVSIERATGRRSVGYFIALFDAGRAVAQCLGILDRITDRGADGVSHDIDRMGGDRPGLGFKDFPGRPWMMARGDVKAAGFAALPSDVEIRYATVPTRIEQEADGVTVTLTDTVGGASVTERFDLVVGADGLRSTVRRLAFGPHEKYLRRLNYMAVAFHLPGALPGHDQSDSVTRAEPQRSMRTFPFKDGPPTVLLKYRTDDAQAEFTRPKADRVGEVSGPEPTGTALGAVLDALESAEDVLFDRAPIEYLQGNGMQMRSARASDRELGRGFMPASMDETEAAGYRPLLFSIAYGMTGSVGDAEDIVQDAFLVLTRAHQEETVIVDPKAYLTTVVTRLGINYLRSARVRRETYVGDWLPEPIVMPADSSGPAEHAELADSLSMAFLVLLEALSPTERAVFMLREVFGYGYSDVARITGKTEVNCRQIFARARRRIAAGGQVAGGMPPPERRAEGQELARRFFEAAAGGDMDALLGMLAPDVVLRGDGGGKAQAFGKRLVGRLPVMRLILGVFRRAGILGVSLRPAWVNGWPGAVKLDAEGRVIGVIQLDIADGMVHTIHSVANPDKLAHIRMNPDIGESGTRCS
ncbi:hypothetical protein GCM10010156_58620 [Planobispora rosea]|uniref:Uncharacterized protein n=1 Tax=Planobispora rosea TaxID=35762 RepID=A0A8J3S5K1_PLARO|nr:RNA polymerase sigma factor SigJ [Planobispora rosea]GGS92585.1 hypothetical protein GCM10010156_58620 [Planobispora rosea]GIH87165.1 hypothetical protein Pro02_55730 [Planobispora rosea]